MIREGEKMREGWARSFGTLKDHIGPILELISHTPTGNPLRSVPLHNSQLYACSSQ